MGCPKDDAGHCSCYFQGNDDGDHICCDCGQSPKGE